jgi:hypothetical protein
METGARKLREIATTVEIIGSLHGPLLGELSTKPEHHGRGKASNRLSRKALGYQVLHHPGPKKNHEVLILFLSFIMK